MSAHVICEHCQRDLGYAGKAGARGVYYCGQCGCVYVDGKHHRDGRYHQAPEEKAAIAESIRRDPEGRELFG